MASATETLAKRAEGEQKCLMYSASTSPFSTLVYVPVGFTPLSEEVKPTAGGTILCQPIDKNGYVFVCNLLEAIKPAALDQKDKPFFTVQAHVLQATGRSLYPPGSVFSVIVEIGARGDSKAALLTNTETHQVSLVSCECLPVDEKRSHLVAVFTLTAKK